MRIPMETVVVDGHEAHEHGDEASEVAATVPGSLAFADEEAETVPRVAEFAGSCEFCHLWSRRLPEMQATMLASSTSVMPPYR